MLQNMVVVTQTNVAKYLKTQAEQAFGMFLVWRKVRIDVVSVRHAVCVFFWCGARTARFFQKTKEQYHKLTKGIQACFIPNSHVVLAL